MEANLKIELNKKLKNLTESTDFSELCITSKAEVIYKDDINTFNDISKLLQNKESYLNIRKNAISQWDNQKTYKVLF